VPEEESTLAAATAGNTLTSSDAGATGATSEGNNFEANQEVGHRMYRRFL
jgi:hypothetical protein